MIELPIGLLQVHNQLTDAIEANRCAIRELGRMIPPIADAAVFADELERAERNVVAAYALIKQLGER